MGRQPCGGVEAYVADTIEAAMPMEGFSSVARECHDARLGMLQVDFVYTAKPHNFALEVTTLTDPIHRAGVAASGPLVERLTLSVRAEDLGSWLVAVSTEHAHMKDLEAEILKIIRDAQVNVERMLEDGSEIWPGDYSPDDLMRLPTKEVPLFIAEHERVQNLGIKSVKPMSTTGDHVVVVVPMTDVKERVSFSGGLTAAIRSNLQKLELAALPQHLAILVDRIDASPTPSVTSVPPLDGLERLWVVQPWGQRHGALGVWVAGEADREWRVY
jgi:hypothetical protein